LKKVQQSIALLIFSFTFIASFYTNYKLLKYWSMRHAGLPMYRAILYYRILLKNGINLDLKILTN